MAKASADIKELQRLLRHIERLDARYVRVAEGLCVVRPTGVVEALFLAGKSARGAVSLADVTHAVSSEAAPFVVEARHVAAARRGLAAFANSKNARAVVAANPRLFRGVRIDAAWLATQAARLDALDDARRAPPADRDAAAHLLALIAFVHGEEAATSARAWPVALWTLALAFDPRGAEPIEGIDADAVPALVRRFGAYGLRLPGLLAVLDALQGQTVADNVEQAIAKLVIAGASADELKVLLARGHASLLRDIEDDIGALRLFARSLAGLAQAGIVLENEGDVLRALRSMGKHALGLAAACLLDGATVQAPAEIARRVDLVQGLFRVLPRDAARLVASVGEAPRGIGKKAHPAFAAWFGDDALLDRYVHIAELADLDATLSRQLRADFERSARDAAEREHLEARAQRSAAQELRLEALAARDATPTAPAPERTQRRMRERITELEAVAYRKQLDRISVAVVKRLWGIELAELSAAWRDALRFHLVIDKNRELLATLLRAAAAAPGADVAPALPANRLWCERAASHFDVAAWLAPAPQRVDVAGSMFTIGVEHDPLQVLRMGVPFDTCLSIHGGSNAASAVTNAADANKRVLYARDAAGAIVGRRLFAISREMKVIAYRSYVSVEDARRAPLENAMRAYCTEWLARARLTPTTTGEPENLHGGFWYDDGAMPLDGREARDATPSDVRAFCDAVGLPCPPTAGAQLRRCAASWMRARGPLSIAEARGEPDVYGGLLLEASRRGPGAMMELAARVHSWISQHTASSVVARHGESLELGRALAIASRVALNLPFDDHGMDHQAMYLLPLLCAAMTTAQTLEIANDMDPAWSSFHARAQGGCEHCYAYGRELLSQATARFYRPGSALAPILGAIRGGPKRALARDVAIYVASQHDLGPHAVVSAALERARKADTSLSHDAHWIAARIRHSSLGTARELVRDQALFAADDVREAGVGLFESLGPLLLERNLVEVLAPLSESDAPALTQWQAWRLAFLRRTRTPLHAAIAREAKNAPAVTMKTLSPLAWLGDTDALMRVREVRNGKSKRELARAREEGNAVTTRGLERLILVATDMKRQVALPPGTLPASRSVGATPRTRTELDERVVQDAYAQWFDSGLARDIVLAVDDRARRGDLLLAIATRPTLDAEQLTGAAALVRADKVINWITTHPALLVVGLCRHALRPGGEELMASLDANAGNTTETTTLMRALALEDALPHRGLLERWTRALLAAPNIGAISDGLGNAYFDADARMRILRAAAEFPNRDRVTDFLYALTLHDLAPFLALLRERFACAEDALDTSRFAHNVEGNSDLEDYRFWIESAWNDASRS